MISLFIAFTAGIAVTKVLSAWLNKEATIAKAILKAEVAKFTPNLTAIKNLVSKL